MGVFTNFGIFKGMSSVGFSNSVFSILVGDERAKEGKERDKTSYFSSCCVNGGGGMYIYVNSIVKILNGCFIQNERYRGHFPPL